MIGSGVASGLFVALFAAIWSLFLLLMMNGFSQRQAKAVLVSYVLLALGAIAASAFGAGTLASRLAKGGPVGFGRGALAALGGAIGGSLALAVLSVLLLFLNPFA